MKNHKIDLAVWRMDGKGLCPFPSLIGRVRGSLARGRELYCVVWAGINWVVRIANKFQLCLNQFT